MTTEQLKQKFFNGVIKEAVHFEECSDEFLSGKDNAWSHKKTWRLSGDSFCVVVSKSGWDRPDYEYTVNTYIDVSHEGHPLGLAFVNCKGFPSSDYNFPKIIQEIIDGPTTRTWWETENGENKKIVITIFVYSLREAIEKGSLMFGYFSDHEISK